MPFAVAPDAVRNVALIVVGPVFTTPNLTPCGLPAATQRACAASYWASKAVSSSGVRSTTQSSSSMYDAEGFSGGPSKYSTSWLWASITIAVRSLMNGSPVHGCAFGNQGSSAADIGLFYHMLSPADRAADFLNLPSSFDSSRERHAP